MSATRVRDIIAKFKITGEIVSALPFGSGNINDTYLVTTTGKKNYLLQRINHLVFKDVSGLMDNLVHVTHHLKMKLRAMPGSDPEKEVLTLVATHNNSYYLKEQANYWRLFYFLDHTKSYDQVQTEQQAFEGGKAFGRFQAMLSDLEPSLIVDTIFNFHNIECRLGNLDKAIVADTVKRLNKVLPEVEFINQRREQMSKVLQQGEAGILPKRIIHNDTKFNNVLLDEQDHAQCVIDLDTVMPGYVAYDFGDAIRTIISTAPEDEPDTRLINLNVPLFSAYAEGYLKQACQFLTDQEVDSLLDGALLLPYMQGVRFLTDYLQGDSYFKIRSPDHNIQRARAQFQLVRKLEEEHDKLKNIISGIWNTCQPLHTPPYIHTGGQM